ncbi:NAD(P)/FAD-dependent oxidoreductase [Allopusillimonas ginsengisoli]|uniref:NAD(P)/FAD-dependent oxidoreductase n=1 Tax=Allopusillimonas ginsengisoli TaxID=453575 RepID=UPI0039C0A832
MNIMTYDVIVVGGSYAGLSAATQMARTRRPVLVIDSGQRRNRFALHSHGFLGQDGRAAADIAADGKEQLLRYPNATWLSSKALSIKSEEGAFLIQTDTESVRGKRVILATGVVDTLPEVDGLQERWGKSIFHCPYCHGYELDAGHIGVIASGELSMHHAQMLPDWGTVTLFTNQSLVLDKTQRQSLFERGVTIDENRIHCISGHADVELEDGSTKKMNGLFTLSRTHMASPLAEQAGCVFETGPLGEFIQVDPMTKKTSVSGLYACGDAARAAGNVAIAVADGAQAGVGTHFSLLFPEH